MKKLKLILAMLVTVLIFSCKNEESFIKNHNDNRLLENLSFKQVEILKKTISSSYKERKLSISEITKIRKVGENYIVSYVSDGKNMEMGFENLFQGDGMTMKIKPGWTVYCTGNCDCALEGVIGDEGTYLQCKCSNCQMHYIGGQKVDNHKYDLENLASESFFKTFKKKPVNIKIIRVMSTKYKKANLMTVYYKDETSKESTFLIITDYKYESYNFPYQGTKKIIGGKDFIVDCIGSCDCRERFYPDDGSIECTCNPCTMTVKEI